MESYVTSEIIAAHNLTFDRVSVKPFQSGYGTMSRKRVGVFKVPFITVKDHGERTNSRSG